jgi:hypothetical protein
MNENRKGLNAELGGLLFGNVMGGPQYALGDAMLGKKGKDSSAASYAGRGALGGATIGGGMGALAAFLMRRDPKLAAALLGIGTASGASSGALAGGVGSLLDEG